MKATVVFSVVMVVALFTLSCRDQGEPVQVTAPVSFPYQPPRYVPGRVVIGFTDSVDYRFIQSFIGGQHLTPIDSRPELEGDDHFSPNCTCRGRGRS